MDTDARQSGGQFPASFPDTFKNFFSMLNEEEDTDVELYSNLLEDKIIPRTSKLRYREYGQSTSGGLRRSSTNQVRSSSFRLHRNIQHQPNRTASNSESSSDTSNYNKHMRYCGLYQHAQQETTSLMMGGGAGVERIGGGGQASSAAVAESAVMRRRSEHEFSISDDEKRRKQFGKLIEQPDDTTSNDTSSDHCDDSDTISTSSSNNTNSSPYSCLLRRPSNNNNNNNHIHQHSPHPSPLVTLHQRPLSTPSVPIHSASFSSGPTRSRRGSMKNTNPSSGSSSGGCAERSHRYPDNIADASSDLATFPPSAHHLSNSASTAPTTPSANPQLIPTSFLSSHKSPSASQMPFGFGTSVMVANSATPSSQSNLNHHHHNAHHHNQQSHHSLGAKGLSVDKINICCCKPTDLRSARSPVPGRRRSSSIASTISISGGHHNTMSTATTTPDHRYLRLIDGGGGGGGGGSGVGLDGTTPCGGGAGGNSGRYSMASTEILHSRFSNHPKSPVNLAGPRTCSSVLGVNVTHDPSSSAIGTPIGCGPGSSIHNNTGSHADASLLNRQRQRPRTASMPVENRKPRLADTRRAAIHCADMDLEYYRLRSFSITSHGICNLGDSMRKRRSVTSVTSTGTTVTSTGTTASDRNRNNSNASQVSNHHDLADIKTGEAEQTSVDKKAAVLAYKVAMLGDSGVGKTALTYQFTTSDYICAYDLSLDDDYGQKTVSVLLNGQETDLEIVDHPACEMSTEAFCSTYNIDIFVVVYSVVDRKSFKEAEKILHYLRDSEMLLTRGAILVGNKTDLERHREVTRQSGRHVAKEVACKFIETSSGLDHNVNELLVGIVAQVKLNPMRINGLTDKQKLMLSTATIQKHRKVDRTAMGTATASVIRSHPIQRRNATNEPNSRATPLSTYGQHVVLSIKHRTGSEDDQVFNDDEEDDDDDDEDDDDGDDDDRASRLQHQSPPQSSSSRTRQLFERTLGHSPKRIVTSDDSTAVGCDGEKPTTNTTPASAASSSSTTSKISMRTKYLLTSFLKFKRTLRAKRRNSSSCSDLFVI